MLSINGFGARYIGIRKTNKPDERSATMWITALYFPIIPIGRHIVQPKSLHGTRFEYFVLEKTPLNWKEIFLTYLFGWIIIPIAGLTPMAFAVIEVQEALGIPNSLQAPIMVLGIIWIIIFLWKLADWDENRWFNE